MLLHYLTEMQNLLCYRFEMGKEKNTRFETLLRTLLRTCAKGSSGSERAVNRCAGLASGEADFF